MYLMIDTACSDEKGNNSDFLQLYENKLMNIIGYLALNSYPKTDYMVMVLFVITVMIVNRIII